ncbi:hypothetical protein AAVH_13757 [Aphelenchoides avenae]|nr:hypothetical protein AAVH_13757 [Aphelenchus avenae]
MAVAVMAVVVTAEAGMEDTLEEVTVAVGMDSAMGFSTSSDGAEATERRRNETMTLPPLCSDCNATSTEEQQRSPPWSLLLLFAKAQSAIGRGAQRIQDFWRGQATRAELLDAVNYAVPKADGFR